MSDIYALRVAVVKALAHPLRLRIIDYLAREGPRCVAEIVDEVGGSQSTVSKHLAVLRKAGIIRGRKEALMVYYELCTPCVEQFFHCIDKVLATDLKMRQMACDGGECGRCNR
ncbi:MAG: ArsR/SmtB family transcription factor [Limnochordia bacterium]|jgi:ArsR family transcriptional regulator|nr:winged helix-turn-helix transcriptional regulator [Bacillota bacterium]